MKGFVPKYMSVAKVLSELYAIPQCKDGGYVPKAKQEVVLQHDPTLDMLTPAVRNILNSNVGDSQTLLDVANTNKRPRKVIIIKPNE